MNLSIADIASFLAVAESGHLTDTASALGIPQPTLSRRIARLEEALGATLFDRIGRSLHLNARGRAFQPFARDIMAATDAGTREVQRLMDPERGTIRIGFMHSLGTWLVPRLLREYRTRYPQVRFELHQGPARDLERAVLNDALDLAFISPAPASSDLEWAVLAQQPLGLAVPAGHRLAGRESVRLEDARDEAFIGMDAGYGIQIILEELAPFTPNIVFRTQEMMTVGGLVASGLGVALLPIGDPALTFPGVCLIPLDPHYERDIGMIWRSNMTEFPSFELFKGFVLGKL